MKSEMEGLLVVMKQRCSCRMHLLRRNGHEMGPYQAAARQWKLLLVAGSSGEDVEREKVSL